ncbi:MAG: helix-turn-helix transcriptional regulator [Ferruginibacter sp.]
MLILQKGSFLGNIKHLHSDKGATVSVTNYYCTDIDASSKHYHEHPNLYFILNGSSVEKKRGCEKELLAGSLQFYYAGEQHQNIRKGFPSESINLEIEYSLLSENSLTEDKINDTVKLFPSVKFAIIKILKELKTNDALSSITINMLILQIISQLKGGKFGNASPIWIKQLHSLLNDCWNETVSLNSLSGTLGISPITISRYFPSYFKCTMGEYMRELKIDRAVELIKSTKLSLTEIAYTCGFADQSHFIRTFKQQTGVLPGKYQRLNVS